MLLHPGIGRASALLLAKQGAKIAVNYASDRSSADSLIEELGGSSNAFAIQADAGSVKDIERMVSETVAKFGRIDILVPNAGLSIMADLEGTTEEDFDKTYALNVKGPYFLAQKAAPHMSAGGRVILLSTSLCTLSNITPNYLLYVSSKGAIEQMTRILSKDLARKGILVNAISPGPTDTDLFLKGKPEELLQRIASFSPFGRRGQPEEIAEGVAYLAGEGSRWVAGQILRINGAMTCN